MIYTISAPSRLTPCSIDLPASKSLSNRALIMNALSGGEGQLEHVSDCDDTKVMLTAFSTDTSAYTYAADGARIIDIGAAGTSMRFLTAYFASRSGAEVVMTGTERMKKRPIALLVEALQRLGGQIEYLGEPGCPPLRIHGKQLAGGDLSIEGSVSSQYVSALLMVAPTLTRGLRLRLTGRITSVPYIVMTLKMMEEYGVTSHWDQEQQLISIEPQPYLTRQYRIESDWSASSYWFQIMALAGEKSIELKGLFADSLQGDAAIAQIFSQIEQRPDCLKLDLSAQPDLAQTVITTCCALGQKFCICGLHTLRIKETDRVAALEQELRKMGYVVRDEEANGTILMTWMGERCTPEPSPIIATYKDHRMAMAFAPLALVHGPLRIDDPMVVSKSYPAFWDDLKQAGFSVCE